MPAPSRNPVAAPAVWDCFLFFDEFDILELHLEELDDVVDHFVLVESTETFRGDPKPLHYADNADRFARFAPKIHHVVVEDTPRADNPWIAQFFQRDAIFRGASDAAPDDLVVIGDVDEIPSRSAIRRAATMGHGEVLGLELMMLYYGLNWAFDRRITPSRVVRRTILDAISPQQVRNIFPDRILDRGGWHLSNFFRRAEAVDRLAAKAQAISSHQYSVGQYADREYLRLCVDGGAPWSASPPFRERLHFREPGDHLPEVVQRDLDGRWAPYLLAEDERDRQAERRVLRRHLELRMARAAKPWATRARRVVGR